MENAQTSAPVSAPEGNAGKLISVSSLIKEAWLLATSRVWKIFGFNILMYLVYFAAVVVFIGAMLLARAAQLNTAVSVVAGVILGAVLLVAAVYFVLRLSMAMVYVVSGPQEQSFSAAYDQTKGKVWAYFVLSLIIGLVFIGSFVLFAIPGIFFMVTLGFASWVFLLEGKTGFQALQQSQIYARGRWWAIFGRMLMLIVLCIIVSMILGIIANALRNHGAAQYVYLVIQYVITMLLTAYAMCYSYVLYSSVSKTAQAGFQPKSWVPKLFMVIGIVVILVVPVVLLGTGAYKAYENSTVKSEIRYEQNPNMQTPVRGQSGDYFPGQGSY